MYYSRNLGHKLKIVDTPSPNKIHSIPIPRSGGLGIFLTFLLGLVIFHNPLNLYELTFLVSIFLIGFIDDMISIPQKIKFGIEIILGLVISLINSWRFTGVYLLDILLPPFI
jgi:UDP-GlcNAc:undecaprenyl-phosphate GlcNAc-1-phosphate transferase